MAVRAGMADLIRRVRDLTTTGVNDYTIGVTSYWSDDQIQSALDRNRREVVDEPLPPIVTVDSDGDPEYRIYQSQYRSWEKTVGGTANFVLRDGAGARVGTAAYTPNYELGRIDFAASVTGGSVLHLSGSVYDVYAAAADIWHMKAGHVAERFDFSADGASFKASQMMAQYERMAKQMERKATFGDVMSVQSVTLVRDDVNLWRNS